MKIEQWDGKKVWVVRYDDGYEDPARYVCGVFTSEALAEHYIDRKVEQQIERVPANHPYRQFNPQFWRGDYDIEETEVNPQP